MPSYHEEVPIDTSVLEEALTVAVDEFVRRLLTQVEMSDLYAVGLYTSGELSSLMPTANTWSAWGGSGGSKWSPLDWAFHLYAQDAFEEVEDVLAAGWSADFASFDIDEERVRAIVHRVLRGAREQYLEGSDVVVGLFMGGMWARWTQESVQAINPPELYGTFLADVGQTQHDLPEGQ